MILQRFYTKSDIVSQYSKHNMLKSGFSLQFTNYTMLILLMVLQIYQHMGSSIIPWYLIVLHTLSLRGHFKYGRTRWVFDSKPLMRLILENKLD